MLLDSGAVRSMVKEAYPLDTKIPPKNKAQATKLERLVEGIVVTYCQRTGTQSTWKAGPAIRMFSQPLNVRNRKQLNRDQQATHSPPMCNITISLGILYSIKLI